MATLVAQVEIWRKGLPGPVHDDHFCGTGQLLVPIVVKPGDTFTETDPSEIAWLIANEAARVQ